MTSFDHRPSNGGGSCARCQASLGLASIQTADVWFCCSACSEDRDAVASSSRSVPENWLYARPRRHFRRRRPKELNTSASGD
jgi:hypothetical protein